MQKSNIFIFTSPSGAGEDTIIGELKKKYSFVRLVNTTTRPIRPGETDGVSYNFLSKEEFLKRVDNDEFFEFVEEDNGHLYGVEKKEIDRIISLGGMIIWKLEYRGAIVAKKAYPEVVTIFVDVPIEILAERIRKRDNAGEDHVDARIRLAQGWYENRDKFDYCVKNENGKLQEAVNEISKIIEAHR